jgi:transposase
MIRYAPADAQWAKMGPFCLGMPTDPGRSGANKRRLLEAVLRIARAGGPWRDLTASFGNRNAVFKRIAMRAVKIDSSFRAMNNLCAAAINSRQISTDTRKPRP